MMRRDGIRKLILSGLLLLLAGVLQSGALDQIGYAQTEAGFKRALLVFGISRGLNGVISVAQGTEVAVEPVGIGLNFKPGEILDPINDLVERFSWVMLASSAFFGVQRVLLEILAAPALSLLTLGVVAMLLWMIWKSPGQSQSLWLNLGRLALLWLILRVSVCMVAVTGEQLYQHFLQPRFTQSQQGLQLATEQIGEANGDLQPPEASASWLDEAKRVYESAVNAVDMQARMQALKRAAAKISEHAINMIVVFLVQTLLFPLLSLWLLWQLMRAVMRDRLNWLVGEPRPAGAPN